MSPTDLDPADLRAFARRDWAALAAIKQARVAAAHREAPLATFRNSQALWCQLRDQRTPMVSEAYVRADFQHHLELRRKLDRHAQYFAGR